MIDRDPFSINQLGHPYQGNIYYGFARSAGLNYWQSLAYTLAGSFLWETAGETTPPSLNDHITSGIGGSFVGEALFRMASLLLEGGGENPGVLARAGRGGALPAHRLQPSRLRRPVRARLPEPRSGRSSFACGSAPPSPRT